MKELKLYACDIRKPLDFRGQNINATKISVRSVKFMFDHFNIHTPQEIVFFKPDPRNKYLINGLPHVKKTTSIQPERLKYLDDIAKKYNLEAAPNLTELIERLDAAFRAYEKEDVNKHGEIIFFYLFFLNKSLFTLTIEKEPGIFIAFTEEIVTKMRVALTNIKFRLKEKAYNQDMIEKTVTFTPGYYSLTDILNALGKNKTTLNPQTAKLDIKGDFSIRPVGENHLTSHGELYDLLFNESNNYSYPDVLGYYKTFNVHCDQINSNESFMQTRTGSLIRNNLIYSVDLERGEHTYGSIITEKSENLVWYELSDVVSPIKQLDFWFSDCRGEKYDPVSDVSIQLVLA